MDSKIGLIIQLNGVFLITILVVLLRRSAKITSLKYWTISWLCLSFSLSCLWLAFRYQHFATPLFACYFLGEYLFGLMLVAGCRDLDDDDKELNLYSVFWIVPFVAIAIILPLSATDFNTVFNIHSFILSGFFAASFLTLRRSNISGFGRNVMLAALTLLTLDFFFYSVVFTLRFFIEFPTDFLAYNSILDLVLETALGFGMVIVVLERVLADLQTANNELQDAHERLESIVHTDPLTAAFTRHAFHGFVKNREGGNAISGCVGFFDIDDLKSINDCFGHAAGDMAIRGVVRAIREIIRAEDLIYRWGGDEFFVIMISMDAEMAEIRMTRLEGMLRSVRIHGVSEPTSIGVSWGFTNFNGIAELESAIQSADSEMYRRKHDRKNRLLGHASYLPAANDPARNAVI